MKKTVLTMAVTTALAFNAPVFAEESEGAKWSGTGQLGFSMTSGNSDTENLTAGLAIKRESEKWVSDLSLDLLRASTNDVETAERYTLNTKTGYKFDENDYGYYGTRWDKDNFSGFDYTISTTVGWGHKFYDNEESKLITEVGLGYKTEA
ncbi:MAG: DUF481 domain-containing protein, partial [Xanthomonadales bacterium]|nr:DUF481 domain-containing protein [Xanthomonadales bacterium]